MVSIVLKVIFAGTPDFARVALEALLRAGFSVPLVLTQPDRPAGRGLQLQASPVKACALEHGIALAQPRSLRLDGKFPEDAAAARAAIAAAQADVMVVAAYGLILPQWVLDLPRLGCLNIHASLLPRWRGAAPIHRAIEAGDAQTGITIMQMDAGLDTGGMLLVESLPIAADDTTASLHDQLASLGGRLIVQALQQAAPSSASAGSNTGGPAGLHAGLVACPQPSEGVSYAHKIDKAEAQIKWQYSAEQIAQKVRALNPAPGASTLVRAELLKIWQCKIDSAQRTFGEPFGHIVSINHDGIAVTTGTGNLLLTQVQRAGGKRISAAECARSLGLQVGEVLGEALGEASGQELASTNPTSSPKAKPCAGPATPR